MPFFTDAEVRQRLKSVGQLASAPEQAELLRQRLTSTVLPKLESALQLSLPAQVSAFEGLKAAAKEEAKAAALQLSAKSASDPSALIGEKIDVYRDGKWRTYKGLRVDSEGAGIVCCAESGSNKAEEVLVLVGEGAEKWRKHDVPAPIWRYSWDGPVDAVLLEVCDLALKACEREHEYAKHGLPLQAAARSSSAIEGYASWQNERMEHPAMASFVYARVARAFEVVAGNAKWMKVSEVKKHLGMLVKRQQEAAKTKAAAATAGPSGAATSKVSPVTVEEAEEML